MSTRQIRGTFALFWAQVFLLALGGCAAGPRADEGPWKAGVARAVITPQESMWMSGYGARNKPSEGKLQDLYAKALALEDPSGKRLVLVTTDLVGLSGEFTGAVARELGKRHGLAREEIMFTVSHTHCGPLLADHDMVYYPAPPELLEKSRLYTERLRAQLTEVVGNALRDLGPAQISWSVGQAGFAVNRREPTPKGIINGTNPQGPVDRDVPILRVASPEGKLRAVAFGYACHNTTLAFYQWCGDYAGFAQEYVEAAHPGATALFFMGCGADANPLPRRTVELCEKYGRQLADAVEAALAGELNSVAGPARTAMKWIDLPLDRFPKREDLETQAKGKPSPEQRRAVDLLKMLETRGKFETTYPYPIQSWQVGTSLTWVALGGEAVVDYAHRLKRELGPDLWVTAYANDVMAYIPSLRVLKEGGYEATIFSSLLAGSSWAPETEERIVAKARDLVADVRGGAKMEMALPQDSPVLAKKLRIVVFGGHPDDPESGCGGLIALLARAGHDVIVAYGTCFRGDRKVGDEPEAVVRRREAAAACKVLGATPHFFDYAHEKLVADAETLKTVSGWLESVKPDIVVAHWPMDTHPNHHVVSSLVWQSYRHSGGWNLYFFEVMTDQQSLGYRPELYLDIESVWSVKKDSCMCHQSQKPESFWAVHEAMHRRRGKECGVTHAEAYVLVEPKKGCPLLPVSFLGKKN